jgi:hypothetical protein
MGNDAPGGGAEADRMQERNLPQNLGVGAQDLVPHPPKYATDAHQPESA